MENPILAEKSGDENVGDQSRTFVFDNEGHTLGNALKTIICRYPDVSFCGYTLPHPQENKMNFRIQCRKGRAIDVLKQGLEDLEKVCDITEEVFEAAMKNYQEDHKVMNTS